MAHQRIMKVKENTDKTMTVKQLINLLKMQHQDSEVYINTNCLQASICVADRGHGYGTEMSAITITDELL